MFVIDFLVCYNSNSRHFITTDYIIIFLFLLCISICRVCKIFHVYKFGMCLHCTVWSQIILLQNKKNALICICFMCAIIKYELLFLFHLHRFCYRIPINIYFIIHNYVSESIAMLNVICNNQEIQINWYKLI